MKKADIQNKAEFLLDESCCFDTPIQVLDIAEYLGFIVVNQKTDFSGAIISNKKENVKCIVLNSKDSLERRRFTLAHEIAHYVLHADNDEIYAHRDDGEVQDSKEREANHFASNLLMPEKSVREFIDSLKKEFLYVPIDIMIKFVAKKYVVSSDAARVRLSVLNII